MKYSFKMMLVLVGLAVAFAIGGCSKFSPPTDEEAIKAITDTGLFAGGIEKFTLKSPIVILEKGKQNKDGSWEVRIKATVTFIKAGGEETAPRERTPVFRIYKSKDGAGKTLWRAVAGSS